MTEIDSLEALDALGVLTDPLRRAAYRAVVGAPSPPVGRDEVAAELGVGRTLAAFHLDKLVDAGLLEVSHARRSGRSGPGAGRPAKLYRRSAAEHAISVPPRDYESAGALLAEALDRVGADATLYQVARERGLVMGAGAKPRADLVRALKAHGYEPVREGARLRLRNCPFHALATSHPPLVCGMNLALLAGLVEGAGLTRWRPVLEPTPGGCCVSFSTVRPSKSESS